MYKNYFFDLYGTLLDVETNEESEFVWEKMALYLGYYGAHYDAYELQNKYKKAVAKMLNSNTQYNHPELDMQDVFYKLFKDKDVKPKKKLPKDAAKVFRMLTTNYLEVFDGVIDMLLALKSQKKNVFVFANAQDVYALYELRKCGIRKYFDEFFFSSELGMCKPEEKFYEAIFSREDIKKKESIIISADYDKDIVGAKALGIDTLFLNANSEEHYDSNNYKYEVKGRDYAQVINLVVK